MIVCHCNVIACTDIRLSVQRLSVEIEAASITAGQVFRCCGARPQCGGCVPSVKRMIAAELDKLTCPGAGSCAAAEFVAKYLKLETDDELAEHEGQSHGTRISEQGAQ